jgi:hypothetical protein
LHQAVLLLLGPAVPVDLAVLVVPASIILAGIILAGIMASTMDIMAELAIS